MHKGIKFALAAVLLLGVIAIATPLLSRDTGRQQARLPDGSIISLEKVTYGTRHEFHRGNALWHRVHRSLPGRIQNFFGQIPTPATTRTDTPMLVPWFTSLTPDGQWTSPFHGTSKVVDSHGCVFDYNNSFGTSYGQRQIGYLKLEAFPRRDRQFDFILSEGTNVLRFKIRNPEVPPESAWKPEPLPVTRRIDGLDFIVSGVRSHARYNDAASVVPEFRVVDHGRETDHWGERDWTWVDATGNRSRNALCFHEPAWKLEVDFYRSVNADFATNEIWKLGSFDSPAPGEFIGLSGSNRLSGVSLELVALSGPGRVVYSNGVPVSAAADASIGAGSSISSSGTTVNGVYIETATVTTSASVLAIRHGAFGPKQRMVVHGTDENGRAFIASGWSGSGNVRFVNITMPEGARRIDLTLIVHSPRSAEYIIKPPEKPAKSR